MRPPLSKFLLLFILSLLTVLTTSCESQRVVINDLEEREANEIIVFLSSKGVDASKVAVPAATGAGSKLKLWNIQVPSPQATEAMAILNMNGLPRKNRETLLNLFAKGGLVPSEMEEQIRYEAGLAAQIAGTIRKIDGVIDADIQLSFPKEDILNPGAETKEKVTASVYVKHQGVLDDPNRHLLTKIKRLVASSINGLEYDNVTIITDKARFVDVGIDSVTGSINENEKDYARIWGVVVASESVTHFRVLVFTLFILFILALLLIVLFVWKMFPLLNGPKDLY